MRKLIVVFFLTIAYTGFSQNTNKLIELTFHISGTVKYFKSGSDRIPCEGTYSMTAHNLTIGVGLPDLGKEITYYNFRVRDIFVKAYPNNLDYKYQLMFGLEDGEGIATYSVFDDFAMLTAGDQLFYVEPLEVSIKKLLEELPDYENINQTAL